LNLNYTYGWHPVSLALPLLFGSILSLLAGRRMLALGLLILACLFKETVLVTAGCLAAAMAIARWRRNRAPSGTAGSTCEDLRLACCLPAIAWAGIWLALSLAMVVILRVTPFAQFQAQRFSNLGDSTAQILLSPVLRPAEFWGQVLSFPSVCFTLALLIPLHLPSLWRGRWTLLALVPPLSILLAWSYPVGRSIAFQYVTTQIPVLFLAAIAGAASLRDRGSSEAARPAPGRSPRCLAACVATLAASLTSAVFFGATPFSSDTLAIVRAKTYPDQPVWNPRAPGTPGNQVLNQIIERLNGDDLAVLATGRIAAHLLNVQRLESVEQATTRWEALEQEAGEGRSAIHVFDWIVLDTAEHLQQSPDKIDFVLQAAISAGYVMQQQQEGILLLCRLGLAEESRSP
jgi:hypothetical protein